MTTVSLHLSNRLYTFNPTTVSSTAATAETPSPSQRNFMSRLLFTFLLLSSFTSCYTFQVFPKEYRQFTYQGERKMAFVLNPELKKEYAILKQSGVFNLTTDSLNDKVIKVRLEPLSRGFVCGNPIIASVFTLGQFPIYFPDTYSYKFQEINRQDTISRDFGLQVAQRIWFWDMFVIKKNFNGKVGQALLGSYYKQ
jgi:hypothetical protein